MVTMVLFLQSHDISSLRHRQATTTEERLKLLEERLAILELSGKVQVSEGTQIDSTPKDSAPEDNKEDKTDKANTKVS